MAINLIDISYYNQITDWKKAASELDGVIIKFSENYYQDPVAIEYVAQAQANNMRVAGYAFYQPDCPPGGQVESFLNVYMPAKMKSIPWLDCEDIVYDVKDSTGKVIRHINIQPPVPEIYTKWLMTWLDAVMEHTGRVPGIYTRASFWNACVQRSTRWANYPLWVANYGVSTPALPLDWKYFTIWQDKSTAIYPWVRGSVDHDIFNGPTTALDALMPRPAPVIVPPPTGEYQVRLLGSVYVLTVRTGPGMTYAPTGHYLINYECPSPSKAVYTILETSADKLWGRIATPYAGWIGLSCTVKV